MPTRQAIALLQSLGVKTLGFNSYRELVSRGETSSQILEFHADLKLADITVQESVYCKIVLKYAKEGNDDLLLSFIASDQHIETLESKSIQMQLLIHYSKTNNPTGIEHTMAVLAALNSTHVDNGIWKKLLLRILDDEPLSRHLEISQELISARIVVPTGVCSRMAKLFRASPYYPEKRFTHFSHLKHILMFLSESADSVGPNSWPDVLQAMRFVPDDLEDLLIELATLYGHMIASQNLAIDHRVNREFQLIFGPSGVKFIIGLGLDVRSIRKATTCPHVMLYGIDLLLRFRQRGLTIHNQGIIRSLNLVRAHRERQLRRHCKYLGANVERFFAANHRQILRLSMGRVFRRVYRRQRSVRQKNMFLPRSRKRHNQKPRER
ncbi:MAG: hypothetical protein M1814_002481 [Vezdaea aestivalis]|nr:MAG: hypothetical protein M1814_002481 [Vezdaea aestivalis]